MGDAAHYPETQGFDVNVGGTHWGAPNTFFHPFSGAKTFRDFRYVPGLGLGKSSEYLTDRLTDEALAATQPERVQQLRQRLDTRREAVGAQLPEPNPAAGR